jgi:nitronate monooxygenase
VVIRSSFRDLFGLDYPIMNAPMVPIAGCDLAAAVANAGGLGMIGGSFSPSGVSPAERLRREIAACRSQTTRQFGVGFISTRRSADGRLSAEELQAVALDAGVTIIGHSFMVPTTLIAEAHRRGARVLCQVQTVAMAREALDAGADVLIAQGYDGGGHVGNIGTLSIVPAIVDIAGAVPVLAAGGIADGRGLAAALMLGAQGANIGSRLVASAESAAPAFAQERMIAAGTDDTVWTRSYDVVRGSDFGPTVAGRAVRNAFTDAWDGREGEAQANGARLIERIDAAAVAGDTSVVPVWASTGIGLIRDVEPAGSLVRTICDEAEQIVRARAALLI